jgi:hypothetical protein
MTPERGISRRVSPDDSEAPHRFATTAAMKILLFVIAGLGALLLLTGGVHFSFQFQDGTASPVLQDLVALNHASASSNIFVERDHVFVLLRRASAKETHAGARDLRRSLPSAATLAAQELAHIRKALEAVSIKTEPGSTCRQAALRLAARSEALYRTLAQDVVARKTWASVRRFVLGGNAAMRNYSSDLKRCIGATPPGDRGQAERIMGL